MHPIHHLFAPHRGLLAAALSALLLVTACGGGGDASTASDTTPSTTTPSTTTAAFTQGTITGFGSVIVNGVRFDDSASTVTDDSGTVRTVSALRLGMRVEIDSSAIDSASATARAHAVRFGGEVTGPVEAVDAAAGTLTVLGQGVDVTGTTVFDDSLAGGLAAVVSGAVVEVHGLLDSATGRIVATRIEREDSPTSYKLRGTVSALDSTARTFRIGGASISYAAVTTVPATLADGVSLRVTLATTAVAGVWQAQSLGAKVRSTTTAAQAHVRGAITAFTSATAFSIDGIPVDASAASFPDGSAGLALGVQVEVQGTLTNGTLVASKVALESRHRGDDDRQFRLHGSITSVDATARTFVLRGITVSFGDGVTFSNGTAAGLVVGARVEVRGTVGSSRTTLAAVRIKFES